MRVRLFLVLPLATGLLSSGILFAGVRTVTYPLPVGPGWNLLSLPVAVQNGASSVLFPSSASVPYVYRQSTGYVVQDTLQNGMGFWLKFISEDTLLIDGQAVFKDTVEVEAGWNLIGTLALPVSVGEIQTSPTGIIASQFFRYMPGGGYQTDTVLQPGLAYWVKASAPGSLIMVGLGGQPCPGSPTVDYAGKTYNTVQIGSQCWLRENLDVGERINGSQDQTDNSTVEKYCWGNDTANCTTYGALYQWDEAMQYVTTQGARGICPPGWHVPTLADFQTLSAVVGDDGNALKRQDQGTGAGQGTNTSGFSGLLAGSRSYTGFFYDLGSFGNLWSSTQNASGAYGLYLYYYSDDVGLLSSYKPFGFSVRCLED